MESPQGHTGGHEESLSSDYSYQQSFETTRVEGVIAREHQQIEAKLAALINEPGLSVNDSRSLFNELSQDILSHIGAEEATYYQAIEKVEGIRSGQIRESHQEHHQMKVLMDELTDVAVEHPDWCAKLRVLEEDLKHHHREEENKFLSRTKDAWSEEEAMKIGSDFLKAKKRVILQ